MTISHDKCVLLASKWLRRQSPINKHRCRQVTTEIAFAGSNKEPDVFGVNAGCGYTVMIECKVQRQDFLKDRKRMGKELGVLDESNWWCGNYKYFCSPEDIIKLEEIPEGWGLLHIINGKVKLVKEADSLWNDNIVISQDLRILTSIINRFNKEGKIMHHRGLK